MLKPLPQHCRVRAVFLHDESADFAVDEAAAATDDVFDAEATILELEDFDELADEAVLRSRCFNVVGRPPAPHSLLFSLIGRAWKASTPDAANKIPDVMRLEICITTVGCQEATSVEEGTIS
jgi:hypothetical protein